MNNMTILNDKDLENICGGNIFAYPILNTASGEFLPRQAAVALVNAGVISVADPTLGALELQVPPPPPPKII